MTPPDGHEAPRPAVRRYAAAWWVLGAVTLVAMLVWFPPRMSDLPATGLWAAFVFLALTAVAEAAVVRIHHGNTAESLTLIEAAIVATLLTFDTAWAFVVILVGFAIALLYRRLTLFKTSFNLAQFTVALAAAVVSYRLLRAGAPPLSPRSLLAALGAMIPFGIVNWYAIAGIVGLSEQMPTRTVSAQARQLSGSNLLGNAAAGMIGAVLWDANPWLIVLALAPLVTLYFAYRGVTRSAELLQQAETERDRLDQVINGASDGIALLDRRGVVRLCSPALAELAHLDPDDAVGQGAPRVFDGWRVADQAFDPMHELGHAVPGRADVTLEAMIAQPDGGARVGRVSLRGIFDNERQLAGAVLLVHDVTRQREVARLKDDFLMRVSHELRTPLTPIKGYAESLAVNLDKATPEMVRMALARIANRADHMTALIDDLLLVANVSTGDSAAAVSERIDLVKRVRELVSVVRTTEPDREFRVIADEERLHASIDPSRFDRVVRVLLSNAMLYSSPDLPIDVRLERDDDLVAVAVHDRGRGIPGDQLEQIFERFHRVEDPLVMTTSGLGVGLYLARHLAVSMGGSLHVASRVGHGSTFVLRLPTEDRDSALTAAVEQQTR